MSADCDRHLMDLILDGDDDSKDIGLLLTCRLRESRHAEQCGRCVTELCGPRDENPTIITSASSGPEQTIRHVVWSADNSRCLWPSTIRTDNPQVVGVHGTHSPNCGHLKTPRGRDETLFIALLMPLPTAYRTVMFPRVTGQVRALSGGQGRVAQ